eukprot:g14535.t1 g14535   contig9:2079654-2080493(-)
MINHSIIKAATLILSSSAASSLLLSALPTPSFIIDVQALRRTVAEVPSTTSTSIPSIRLPANGSLLRPQPISSSAIVIDDNDIVDVTFPVVEGQPAIGYLHSTVTRAREDAIPGEDDPISTFLAEIDLSPTLCGSHESSSEMAYPAKLVLGLNNHHVGSYYWARSAGAGSSMEAPGVGFGSGTTCNRGFLRWLDEEGPTLCNSNDGKRSEWVNFLRKGDTVQLLPSDGQDSLLRFYKQTESYEGGDGTSPFGVFGISLEGRPMGSEPAVVCTWWLDVDE